jgi:hypothetical protein
VSNLILVVVAVRLCAKCNPIMSPTTPMPSTKGLPFTFLIRNAARNPREQPTLGVWTIFRLSRRRTQSPKHQGARGRGHTVHDSCPGRAVVRSQRDVLHRSGLLDLQRYQCIRISYSVPQLHQFLAHRGRRHCAVLCDQCRDEVRRGDVHLLRLVLDELLVVPFPVTCSLFTT